GLCAGSRARFTQEWARSVPAVDRLRDGAQGGHRPIANLIARVGKRHKGRCRRGHLILYARSAGTARRAEDDLRSTSTHLERQIKVLCRARFEAWFADELD